MAAFSDIPEPNLNPPEYDDEDTDTYAEIVINFTGDVLIEDNTSIDDSEVSYDVETNTIMDDNSIIEDFYEVLFRNYADQIPGPGIYLMSGDATIKYVISGFDYDINTDLDMNGSEINVGFSRK